LVGIGGVTHFVVDSPEWATNDDPERVQRLILFRFERDTQNRVFNVTNGEEVQEVGIWLYSTKKMIASASG
jgi:hypothetical protein